MGPGMGFRGRGRGRGRGSSSRYGSRGYQGEDQGRRGGDRSSARSVRVGEVPVFNDRTDPKVYRRNLMDWVRFQDLADPNSSKKLTLGQQVFAVIAAIQGSAGHRLEHVTDMLHAQMSREEFTEVLDHILEVVDPVDRDASFLETAKAWKDLMAKGHGQRQSYDHYWTEYSSLCVRYASSHGKVAQSPGVQELTALLCVLNARLDKTEFAMVLQAAMQYQSTLKTRSDRSSIQKRQGTIVSGRRSAMDVLSQCSQRGGGQLHEASTAASGVTQTPSQTVGLPEMLATLKVDIIDNTRRYDAVQALLLDCLDKMSPEMDNEVIELMRKARIKLTESEDLTRDARRQSVTSAR